MDDRQRRAFFAKRYDGIDPERQKMLDYAKKRGVTHMDGVPIERVVDELMTDKTEIKREKKY